MNLSSLWDTWIGRSVSEVQSELRRHGLRWDDALDKLELVSRLVDYFIPFNQNSNPQPQPASPSRRSSTHVPRSDAAASGPTAITTLDQLSCEDDVNRLSGAQLKQLLISHNVNTTGMIERSELLSEVKRLWRSQTENKSRANAKPANPTANGATCGSSERPPSGNNSRSEDDDRQCCICMNAKVDCAFVRCGHLATCYPCGKNLEQCPICRQTVEFSMRVYPA